MYAHDEMIAVLGHRQLLERLVVAPSFKTRIAGGISLDDEVSVGVLSPCCADGLYETVVVGIDGIVSVLFHCFVVFGQKVIGRKTPRV